MPKTTRGINRDRMLRSKEDWERGKGAKKIGNPRYKPVNRTYTREGKRVTRKMYVLRK